MLVVLASGNQGKVRELKDLLPDWVDVKTATELRAELPDETGETFLDNALLKARAVMDQTGLVAIADDSGLEVDALNGAPGVRSARFAGDPGSDEANNALLISRLTGLGAGKRGARFRSVVAVVAPDGTEFWDEGTVDGEILPEPMGSNGFGYDPLFQPTGHQRTFAQLSLDQKNEISHRGRAFRKIAPRLISYLQSHQAVGNNGADGSKQTSR